MMILDKLQNSNSSFTLSPIPEDKRLRLSKTSQCVPLDDGDAFRDRFDKAIETASRKGIHALVNAERKAHNLPPLQRSRFLDSLASLHATVMAKECRAMHSVDSIVELQCNLHSKQVAENVDCGDYIRQMHSNTMESDASTNLSKENILSPIFTEMGSAVARGTDGKIYLCQLFRKR